MIEPPQGSRQFQRGNLYVIVELFGQSAQNEALAGRMAGVLQRAYYSAKGSQAEVMATGIEAAHKLLQEHNQSQREGPIAAGLLCAALLNGRLLIATSGSAFALVRADDKVHMFPSEVEDSGTVDEIPERIEVFRQDVDSEDVIFLGGGSWLHTVKLRTLAGVVAYTSAETCAAAADELFDLGGASPMPGLLLVLGSDSQPPDNGSTGGGPQENRGPGGAGGGKLLRPKRPRLGGLPTAVSAAPVPSSGYGGAGADVDYWNDEAPPGPEPPPGRVPARGAADRGQDVHAAHSARDAYLPGNDPEREEPLRADPGADFGGREAGATLSEEDDPGEPGMPPKWQTSFSSLSRQFSVAAAAVWASLTGFFGRMLPDSTPQSEPDDDSNGFDGEGPDEGFQPEPDEMEAAREHTQGGADEWAPIRRAGRGEAAPEAWQNVGSAGGGQTRKPAEFQAAAAAIAPDGPATAEMDTAAPRPAGEPLPPMPEIEPFEAPEPTRGARARLFILLAVMVVVLAPAVVGGIYLSEAPSRRAEAEQLTDAAVALFASAQNALDLDDRVVARRQLTEAQDFLNQAVAMDDWTDRRRALAQQIQAELDEVAQVLPLYGLTTPMLAFEGEADPVRIVVVNDEIYILDAGEQAVYRYRFDPTGGNLTSAGQVVLRQGDTVGNVVVGALHDISWLPQTAGREDRPSLLILDRQNNVFRFDQRVEGVTRLVFGGQEQWGSIGQIESYGGRVYVADEATGQIYRYDAGRYEAPGEPWFPPETQTSLTGIRGMAIDGDIWFLYDNGMILRYRDRQQVPFSLESGFGFAEEPGDFYVARESRALIYLVDRRNNRVLVYNKQGEYQYQLVAPEGNELEGVSALAVDEIAGRMFILTRSGLYLHPLVE